MTETKIKNAFVTYAIEQSLFEIGGSQLVDEVSNLLLEKYGSDIMGCFRHPDHLNYALNVIFGKSHKQIIFAIQTKLQDFIELQPIAKFSTILR